VKKQEESTGTRRDYNEKQKKEGGESDELGRG
jgi:hypothetical protein